MQQPSRSGKGFPIPREVIFGHDFLDQLREAQRAWSIALFDPHSGGFRQNDEIGVNTMSSTDMVWIRHATHDPEPGAPDKDKVIGYLEGAQDPETGKVCHARGPAGQHHCDAHALWQTVRALNILGGRLRHFPHHLRGLVTPGGLEAWFDSIDWDSRLHSNHHEVLGILPLLVSLDSKEWTEVFYQKLGEQQDAASGAWPRGRTNISRTFAYTSIHLAGDRLPRYPEKIIDTILALQRATGFWDGPRPAFHTMDAAFLLVRLPTLVSHREAEARESLRRLAKAVREDFAQHQAYYAGNPHKMSAITHTFGLLQEAFPEEFASDPRYRFDWGDPWVYVCDVIRDA